MNKGGAEMVTYYGTHTILQGDDGYEAYFHSAQWIGCFQTKENAEKALKEMYNLVFRNIYEKT